jgi:hypothetical protein
LRLDRVVESPNVAAAESQGRAGESAEEAQGSQTAEGTETETEAVGSTEIASRRESSRVVLRRDQAGPFTVQIAFQGGTLFRFESDGGERREEYAQNGDSYETEVEEEFRIWLSNAGAARVQVAGREVDLGSPGEVTAELFTWVGGEQSDSARLELIPMY